MRGETHAHARARVGIEDTDESWRLTSKTDRRKSHLVLLFFWRVFFRADALICHFSVIGLPATLFKSNPVPEKHVHFSEAEIFDAEIGDVENDDDGDDVKIGDSADADAGTESDADAEDFDEDGDDDDKSRKKVSGKKRPASKSADVSRASKMPRRQVKPPTQFSPVDVKKPPQPKKDEKASADTAKKASPAAAASTLKPKKTKKDIADENDARALVRFGDLTRFPDKLKLEGDRIGVADQYWIKDNNIYTTKGSRLRISLDWIDFMGVLANTLGIPVPSGDAAPSTSTTTTTTATAPLPTKTNVDFSDTLIPTEIEASLSRSDWANADSSQPIATMTNNVILNEAQQLILKDITETKTASAMWEKKFVEVAHKNALLTCKVDDLTRANNVVNARYEDEKKKIEAATAAITENKTLRQKVDKFEAVTKENMAIINGMTEEAMNKHVKEVTDLKLSIKKLEQDVAANKATHDSVLRVAHATIDKLTEDLETMEATFKKELDVLQASANAATDRVAELGKDIEKGDVEVLHLKEWNKQLTKDKNALVLSNAALVAKFKTAVVDCIKNLDVGDVCAPAAEKSTELI
jgi:hypothetical protein